MSEENIAFRLKFLIENLGISSSQFADKCGITRPTLSQLLTGRNKKISNLIIEQIHSSYPTLSILWLLFGEGDMWSTTDSRDINDNGNPLEPLSSNKAQNHGYDESSSVKNADENQEILTSGQSRISKSKENAVNPMQNDAKDSDNEEVNRCLKNTGFLNEINKFSQKPRRVVQVTIYYDDSTFQTFYPK